jgi:hypothetical protein
MSQQVVSLSYRARRELVAQMAPHYHQASLARKMMMLDSLVETTGYARKYAIGLLIRKRKCRQPFGVRVSLAMVPRSSRRYSWPGELPALFARNA